MSFKDGKIGNSNEIEMHSTTHDMNYYCFFIYIFASECM